jgi:hypothetical protein
MKAQSTVTTKLQPETMAALAKLPDNVVDAASMRLGLAGGEPLLLALDGLLRYAKAYEKRFEGKLADDHYLGREWYDAIKAIHGLLNGDGVVALEKGITTDSKCNGVMEEIYWAARNAAGFADETEATCN